VLDPNIDDLMAIEELSEHALFHKLRLRFQSTKVYTALASILIAVNPFQALPLYTPELKQLYINATLKTLNKTPPHLYKTVQEALLSMQQLPKEGIEDAPGASPMGKQEQLQQQKTHRELPFVPGASHSIVLFGESGAGKTESTKHILDYLAAFSLSKSKSLSSPKRSSMVQLEEQVCKANTLMQAFGNAKTFHNHNASRFGKLLGVKLGVNGQLNSCVVQIYLLEKSRICHRSASGGEGNFHMFYYMLAGMAKATDAGALTKELGVEGMTFKDFKYSACEMACDEETLGMHSNKYKEILSHLKTFGSLDKRQMDICRVLAALLHLGNIDFTESTSGGGGATKVAASEGEPEPGRRSPQGDDVPAPTVEGGSKQSLEVVATLLSVAPEVLLDSLTKRELNIGGKKHVQTGWSNIQVPYSVAEAGANRDATAKFIYLQLFEWFAAELNQSLARKDEAGKAPGTPTIATDCTLNVLDIFGFEVMKYNSFEQLCINYCNEKLHEFYISHLFKAEERLFQEQGIEVDTDSLMGNFSDNQKIVELISGRGGLFAMLSDLILAGSRDVGRDDNDKAKAKDHDAEILTKIRNKFYCFPRNHPNCVVTSRTDEPAEWEKCFSVVHFAGEVVNYNITGFRQKNVDKVPERVNTILRTETKNDFLKVRCNENAGRICLLLLAAARCCSLLLAAARCCSLLLAAAPANPSFCFTNTATPNRETNGDEPL
jgi:myosin heavy subunit